MYSSRIYTLKDFNFPSNIFSQSDLFPLHSNSRKSPACSTVPRIYPSPFYRDGQADSSNLEILPRAPPRRAGNPLTCKTVLPLGLPRLLLSVFFAVFPLPASIAMLERRNVFHVHGKERNRPSEQAL